MNLAVRPIPEKDPRREECQRLFETTLQEFTEYVQKQQEANRRFRRKAVKEEN